MRTARLATVRMIPMLAIADRSTHDADCPNAGRGRVTRGEITLSDDCARADETDAGDHALHDICVHGGIGPRTRISQSAPGRSWQWQQGGRCVSLRFVSRAPDAIRS